jgi:hypothetical protein
MTSATEHARRRPTGQEPDFIELPSPSAPAAMGPAATVASAVPRVRRFPVQPVPRLTSAPPDADEEHRPWTERFVHWITGDAGAGYGMSLVLHAILLAILAIPIVQQLEQGPIFSTEMSESPPDEVTFDAIIDTDLKLPDDEPGGQTPTSLPIITAEDALPLAEALIPQVGAGGTVDGLGAGDIAEGIKQFVPANAVTKGSFTAWTTPIYTAGFPKRFGDPDPKPGESPRPRQPYHITIQIKVPVSRKTYNLRDLTGLIVGTDGYNQRIPEHTYVLMPDGALVQPRGNVRVKDGMVQIVVLVPGAVALVRDTIEISSRLLDEEQTLELVFDGGRQ